MTNGLRVLLPLDLRLELTRRALEELRSPEAQAEYLLARSLKRSLARRQTAIPKVAAPANQDEAEA